MLGVKYWKGELESKKIEKIPGTLKRGVWQFTPSSEQLVLDNGLRVNSANLSKQIEEKQEFLKGRKQALEFKSAAE